MPGNPVLFRCAAQEYAVGKVLAAAAFRGDLDPVLSRLSEKLACESYGEEERFSLGDDALQAASDAFRSHRGLHSATETERWLADRLVSLDDFDAYLSRTLWLQRFADRRDEVLRSHTVPRLDIEACLWQELVFDGLLVPLALPLAQRVAVAQERGEAATDLLATIRSRFFSSRGLTEGDLPGWLESAGCERSWFDILVDLEARFSDEAASVLTPERFGHEIVADRIGLTRVDFEIVEVPDPDVAQEMCLSLRVDGASLEQLCRETALPARSISSLLRDLPEELRQPIFSAGEGEVLGPLPGENGHTVILLARKREPDAADAELRALLSRRILESHLARQVGQHIAWVFPVEE